MYKYNQQDWSSYDHDKTLEENIANGAVATQEKMEHIEEGLMMANNTLINIKVSAGSEDLCTVTEANGKRVYDVQSSSLEPKQMPLEIIISTGIADSTQVVDDVDKGKRIIKIVSSSLEPRWNPTDIILVASETENTRIEDADGRKKITISSPAINNFVSKPLEKDTMIDIDDWAGDTVPFEAILTIDSITSANMLRFTKGTEITPDQIKAINDCGVSIMENLDGTIKAIATKSKPTIDIPIHVTIL